ncbi:MAG: hypothetical protein AAF909_11945 [Pseudomonadota bacterium]
MTTAAIIDLFISPALGGLGAFLGVSWLARSSPEKYQAFSSLSARLSIGVAVALGLFASKFVL